MKLLRSALSRCFRLLSALLVASLALGEVAAEGSSFDGVMSSSTPDHFYVERKGDAFEYVKVPGADVETQNRVLVWYMGRSSNNEPVVRYQDGASSGMLSCFDNCQFVRGSTFVGGTLVQTGRIRVTNDPLIYAIMHDARAGQLTLPDRARPLVKGPK
jgi:hypothetical protein